jgi:hypothetical protein
MRLTPLKFEIAEDPSESDLFKLLANSVKYASESIGRRWCVVLFQLKNEDHASVFSCLWEVLPAENVVKHFRKKGCMLRSRSCRRERSCMVACACMCSASSSSLVSASGMRLPKFFSSRCMHWSSGSESVWKVMPAPLLSDRRLLIVARNLSVLLPLKQWVSTEPVPLAVGLSGPLGLLDAAAWVTKLSSSSGAHCDVPPFLWET